MFEQELLPTLQTARSRYQDALVHLDEAELGWKLAPDSNSIGFLIHHIAEVEYRFCMMFFGRPLPPEVTLTTIGPVRDEGNFTDLSTLLAFKEASFLYLLDSLAALPKDVWDIPCEAPIATLTPRQALGRLIYHMGYHGGQIGLIRKYGGPQ
ncbi:DinB family protein [Brevibacillus fortis]|uniref:DinB family protein n=1 Tax=Brevibacillus fortis TaxID=2126352 RepID=A0A2P7VE68_9BACL|nr:DinB family protein [Brevibacillus fortis]MED1782746.1 DinB family protein [Brevibacillus fortis]PSJ97515.1 DinB family protein [Brevibacillus fortis]